MMKNCTLAIVVLLSVGIPGFQRVFATSPKVISLVELERVPKPSSCFTQGLEIKDGLFYESCGRFGKSEWRSYDRLGNLKKTVKNSPSVFAEGLTHSNQGIVQIFWKNGKANVWTEQGELTKTLANPGREGWGVAAHPEGFFLTDGSDEIWHLDPQFEVQKRVKVRLKGRSMDRLNELERVNSLLLMNRWQTAEILLVEPHSGRVIEVWDLSSLWKQVRLETQNQVDVPNGIAWNAETQELWVTGKLWPFLHRIKAPGSALPIKK